MKQAGWDHRLTVAKLKAVQHKYNLLEDSTSDEASCIVCDIYTHYDALKALRDTAIKAFDASKAAYAAGNCQQPMPVGADPPSDKCPQFTNSIVDHTNPMGWRAPMLTNVAGMTPSEDDFEVKYLVLTHLLFVFFFFSFLFCSVLFILCSCFLWLEAMQCTLLGVSTLFHDACPRSMGHALCILLYSVYFPPKNMNIFNTAYLSRPLFWKTWSLTASLQTSNVRPRAKALAAALLLGKATSASTLT